MIARSSIRHDRRIPALVLICAVALLLPAGASTSSATSSSSPGRAGLVAFVSDRDQRNLGEVYTVSLGSGRARNATGDWREQLSPIVSPSGTWIAYRTFRALYVMRRDGSGRRRLADVDHYSPHLSWSPDSRMLAYASGNPAPDGDDPHTDSVFAILARGGAPQSIGPCSADRDGTCFAWSPDSRRLALARNTGLVIVHAAGAVKERILVPGPVRSPSWSPDGRRIGFVEGHGEQTKPNAARVVAAAGGRVGLLAPSARTIVWSPDSSRVVVDDGDALVVVSADGARRRWIVQPLFGELRLPRWLPGGRSLVYVYESGSSSPELRRVDADGGRNRRIARLPYWVESLSVTPDGTNAIAGVRLDGPARTRLYTMHSDGTRARLLDVGEDVRFPAWSPDGMRLAFLCARHLCVADADGRNRRRLTRVWRAYSDSERLAWSPDATRILFSTAKGLHQIGAAGGKPRPLPNLDARAQSAAWSPDGRRLAYELFGHVTISRSDGTEAISVETGELYTELPDWSPDGRSLVVAKEYNAQCPRICPPYGLVVFSSEGKLVRELTAPDDYSFPTWSPDGRRIAFERSGRIWWIAANGGPSRRLQGFGQGFWSDSTPSWQPRCTRFGTGRAEAIPGTPGPDLLCALDGDDVLVGGRGEDRLFGHEGDDRIDARDNAFDVVGCGSGRDVVRADRVDLVGGDCEQVTRS